MSLLPPLFSLEATKEFDYIGVSFAYKNPTTGVQVSLEPREGGVFAYVIKLLNGAIPAYLDAPEDWLLVDCLIYARAQSANVSKAPVQGTVTGDLVKAQLNEYSRSLRAYGQDFCGATSPRCLT